MKKSSMVVSALAAICTATAAAPLAHAADQPQFNVTATGGIDAINVEIDRPADFLTACHTYGVPSGTDPVTTDHTFGSVWTDGGWNTVNTRANDN